ncbi:I78 family peptidase inhibitor [Yoonia sediminilitoris]|uniref:Peptidase inhibitor I78 family protein n=1 Tax=Yoonia sediminilitoris TaxID=1286148 RepID=A0A2T6KID2_9RHOB|nr:I78 family peptidase inhibitor [Yoonia sediminilitoris]PUB15468.1 peptidase inhibitor I78 family protein [Yoonia sediminilitoris]RCW96078.1 peptidase inhibitor I78 family protein [Yoonia sediminilitoris]
MKRLGLLILLAGCAAAPTPAPITPRLPDTCDAESYGYLVGQDATALETVLIMRMVRVIRPGDLVTQDYRPQRINFEIDRTNRIAGISCG